MTKKLPEKIFMLGKPFNTVHEYLEHLQSESMLPTDMELEKLYKYLTHEHTKWNQLSKMSKGNKDIPYSVIPVDGKYFALYKGNEHAVAAGMQGMLKLAVDLETKEWCLVKISNLDTSPKMLRGAPIEPLEEVAREVRHLHQRDMLHGTHKRMGKQGNKVYTFMPIIPGMLLNTFTKRVGAKELIYSDIEKVDFYINCFKALAALREQNVVHRDLHGGNVLIDEKTLEPTLIDFGLARELGPDGTTWLKIGDKEAPKEENPPDKDKEGLYERIANGFDLNVFLPEISDVFEGKYEDRGVGKEIEEMLIKIISEDVKRTKSEEVGSEWQDVDIKPYIARLESLRERLELADRESKGEMP